MTAVLLIGHVATEEGKGREEDNISWNSGVVNHFGVCSSLRIPEVGG